METFWRLSLRKVVDDSSEVGLGHGGLGRWGEGSAREKVEKKNESEP